MQLKEEKRDLFSVNNEKDMWYVQCISADFACGKGIRYSSDSTMENHYMR